MLKDIHESMTPGRLAIARRLAESIHIEHTGKKWTSVMLTVAHEDNPVLLLQAADFVQQVMKTTLPAYIQTANGGYIKNRWFQKLLHRLEHLLLAPYLKYRCGLEIHAFYAAAEQAGLTGLTASDPATVNRFIDCIRMAMHSDVFRKLGEKLIRKSRNNFKSGKRYINRLFKRLARLLVIRIDLHYRSDYAREVTLAKLNADLERMFNNTRGNSTVFGGMVGRIVCLEYGELTGLHVHLILFFDGAKRQQDVAIAQLIGHYWVNNITEGKGRFYNCNLSKDKYRNSCIGRIEHHDHAKRKTLLECLAYLTKVEQYLVYQEFDGTQTFRPGKLREEPENKLGRPRTHMPPKAA